MTEQQNIETSPEAGQPIESDEDAHAAVFEGAPYTSAAHARARLAYETVLLADTALEATPVRPDREAEAGALINWARSLAQRAARVVAAAVVAEREAGRSWEQIGAAFGATRQAVTKRFEAEVRTWETEERDQRPNGKPWGFDALQEHIATLVWDAEVYLAARTAPEDPWADDPHPVAAHLPRHTTQSQLTALADEAAALHAAYAIPDPADLAAIAKRRGALFSQAAAEADQDDERAEYEHLAELEYDRADALRRQPAGAVPFSTAPAPSAGRTTAGEYVPNLAKTLPACVTLAVAERLATAVFNNGDTHASNTPGTRAAAARSLAKERFAIYAHAAALSGAGPAKLIAWAEDDGGEPMQILTDRYGLDPDTWPDPLSQLPGHAALEARHQRAVRLHLVQAVQNSRS